MNRYELTHRAKCPNGGLVDCYAITIESPTTIHVEEIAKTIKESPDPIFQEDLADHLRNLLGSRVVIIGTHHGIKITTTRE
jgi:hypothetical protein